MKKIYSLLVLLLTFINCSSQNLVQNPGFENYVACPNAQGQVHYASPWITPTLGSPDYYNSCNASFLKVPSHWYGYQAAHGGNSYVGGYLWQPVYGSTNREYVEGALSSALVKGRTYHFEMFVNLTDSSGISTSSIGAYFSDTLVKGINNYDRLPFTPQIQHSGSKFDKVNWTLVSGDFVAKGGERYVIIGNFKTNANTDTVTIDPLTWRFVYTLIDDVSVTCKDCEPTGINSNNVAGVRISPNPFSTKLVFNVAASDVHEVLITDINARPVVRKSFSGSLEINTSDFPSGLYFYEIRNQAGLIVRDKILKL